LFRLERTRVVRPGAVGERLSQRRLLGCPRSVRGHRCRLVDDHRVGPPHDLDRVGRGARALVGGEHGHDPHGHSIRCFDKKLEIVPEGALP
jgi:hypothetical protein